jgi:asparagine synthase (glutamine-hydrolysing)
MCGFAGEIAFRGDADVAAAARMAATMSDRGPDASGCWAHDGIALAHRRLEIIDLSPCAAQPMVDSLLGLAIAFNGCIYNHRELRGELERDGYAFFSTSDTEVLLKAYHHWGEDFVERLKGMFAIAIAERDSGELLLVRDRLGIKPLYITPGAERLRFASTLPALLAGGEVDTSIDPSALHHYLTFHSVVPAPRTLLAGVRRVAPGTMVRVSPRGTMTTKRYWQLSGERDPEREGASAHQWSEWVLDALRTAVQRRMVADVPVGVLLSGGLDSSLIVALLAEAGQSRLATFSVGFERVGDREGDEFVYSDAVAARYETDHRKFVIREPRLLPALQAAVAAMSEPMVSHDVAAFHLLSEEVSEHVKVVQCGQGADEVFAGYDWYPPMRSANGDGAATYAGVFFDRTQEEIEEALVPELTPTGEPSREFVDAHFAHPGAATPVDRALRLDTEVMLVDDPVKRVDNMTMAWGLEARVPFLDHDLVELAACCPPELKLAHGGKGVLKDAARHLLPAEVVDRPKGYFPVPALIHLEGAVFDFVRDVLCSSEARSRCIFRPTYVERLLADPNGERTPLGGNKLWQLAMLEMWMQAHGV